MNLEIFDDFLSEAAQNHFKLLVLPDQSVDKTEIMEFLTTKDWQLCDITKEFLGILERIPKEKRRLRGSVELEKWLRKLEGDRFAFNNIDLLFSPELGKIDPIRMFKYFSRDRKAVLFFPGRIRGRQAEYSLEGRPDHIIMDVSEVLVYPGEDKGE